MIVSASALVRHCGYARKLDRERPKSANAQVACDRGTIFHQAVESWLRTRELPVVADMEIQGWLDLLASQWEPPIDAVTEIAWGLSPLGEHVRVREAEPHVYVAADGSPLLTAGRADVAWRSDTLIVADFDFGGAHDSLGRTSQGVGAAPAGAGLERRESTLVVVDYKTGKWTTTPAPTNLQVNAAGIALARKYGAGSYQPQIYYARDGYWDVGPLVVFGTPAYDRIFAEVRAAALLDETPRPGDHCRTCWSKRACAHAA